MTKSYVYSHQANLLSSVAVLWPLRYASADLRWISIDYDEARDARTLRVQTRFSKLKVKGISLFPGVSSDRRVLYSIPSSDALVSFDSFSSRLGGAFWEFYEHASNRGLPMRTRSCLRREIRECIERLEFELRATDRLSFALARMNEESAFRLTGMSYHSTLGSEWLTGSVELRLEILMREYVSGHDFKLWRVCHYCFFRTESTLFLSGGMLLTGDSSCDSCEEILSEAEVSFASLIDTPAGMAPVFIPSVTLDDAMDMELCVGRRILGYPGALEHYYRARDLHGADVGSLAIGSHEQAKQQLGKVLGGVDGEILESVYRSSFRVVEASIDADWQST